MPPLPYYFPFINNQTISGFSILLLQQLTVSIIYAIGNASFDGLLLLIFVNIHMVSSIIVGHIDDLNCALNDSDSGKDTILIKRKLIEIIRMHVKCVG